MDLDSPPIEAITLRQVVGIRKCLPDRVRAGDMECIQQWGQQLAKSLIRYPGNFPEAKHRDNALILLLFIQFNIKKAVPKPLHTGEKGQEYVIKNKDADITNNEVNSNIMQWLASKGSSMFPEGMRVAIGRVLAVLAYEDIKSTLTLITVPTKEYDDDVFIGMIKTFTYFITRTKLDRTVDWQLHAYIRSRLSIASLGYLEQKPRETAMHAVNEDFKGEETNKLVRDFIRTPAVTRMNITNWDTDYSTMLFVIILGYLREVIDDISVPLLVNNEIASYKYGDMPTPFILSGNFAGDFGTHIGYVHNKHMYVVHPQCSYPVLRTLLNWCGACIEHVTLDKSAAFYCIYNSAIDPDSVESTNKYKQVFGVK